ncbi:hypothetical protein NC651_020553 [Populus alba x Populus x berolinensis]|nr:hypothetical protein NC651_020553 [Populus alba x Populus x berolinensis]
MDGIGTYIGSNGDTYIGQWVMNMKHGHVLKHFSNGDWYDGEWRCGFQEGINGKYEWKNSNQNARARVEQMIGASTGAC